MEGGANIGAGMGMGMGRRLRDCSDASHGKGLERDADRPIDCWLMHHPLPESRIWQLGVLQRSSSK